MTTAVGAEVEGAARRPPRWTLVRLLGEQTHPVVILAVMLGEGLDRVVILGTQAVEGRAAHAKAAINRLEPEAEVEFVEPLPPYDWRSVRRKVGEILRRYDHPILDLTGGTKLMMLGAYLAGKARGAPMVYVETGTKTVQVLDGVAEGLVARGWPDIGLEALLLARGFRVEAKKAECLPKEYLAVCNTIVDRPHVWWEWLRLLAKRPADRGTVTLSLAGKTGKKARRLAFPEILMKHGLATMDGANPLPLFRDSETQRTFTGGHWLERYVAAAALEAGVGEVWVNGLCTKLESADAGVLDNGGPDHEFDVALVRGTTLHLVSCKSGRKDAKSVDILTNDVRQLGGSFGRGALVSLNPVSEQMAARARDNGLAVWHGGDLGRERLAELIGKWVGVDER